MSKLEEEMRKGKKQHIGFLLIVVLAWLVAGLTFSYNVAGAWGLVCWGMGSSWRRASLRLKEMHDEVR